jgi:hypothetical protein
MARYLDQEHPQEVLKWNEIKLFCEKLGMEMTEGTNKLRITFPSTATPTKAKVISFKELRIRAGAEANNSISHEGV